MYSCSIIVSAVLLQQIPSIRCARNQLNFKMFSVILVVLSAQVFALFEGGVPDPNRQLIPGTLHLSIYSQYPEFNKRIDTDLLSASNKNALDVTMSPRVNHYGPNDFAAAFNHAHTNCSGAFLSEESAAFQTTKKEQDRVIHFLAKILSSWYFSYTAGGDKVVPLVANVVRKLCFVGSVNAPPKY